MTLNEIGYGKGMARKKNDASAHKKEKDRAAPLPSGVILPGTSPKSKSGVASDALPGDRIPFGRWTGTEVKMDSDDLLIMKGEGRSGPRSIDSAEQRVRDKLGEAVAPLAGELMSRRIPAETFSEEMRHFAHAFLERYDETNPPPVPKRRFIPRQDQILDFLREAWGEWIERGLLTKPLLKAHDEKAYDALMNWQRANSLPDDLYLPTQKEANDRFLERRYFTVDEAHRVVGLIARRDRKQ